MMKKLREKLYRFMYGRNGMDQLSSFIMSVALVLIIPSFFIKKSWAVIFVLLFWVLTIYAYVRTFSKKLEKRQRENNIFLGKINYFRTKINQRKEYKFFNCPKCGAHLRVPKGVGKVTVICKKCGYEFDRRA